MPGAVTVLSMIWVLIGAAIGAAIVVGPLSWAAGPFDAILAALVDVSATVTTRLIGLAGTTPEGTPTTGAQVAAAFLAVLGPGLIAVVLGLMTRGTLAARRVIGIVFMVAAVGSFWFVPAGTAFVLVAIAGVIGAITSFATGAIVVAPLTTAAVILGIRNVQLVLNDKFEAVGEGAAKLAEMGAGEVGLWKVVLAGVAIAPYVAAGLLMLSSHKAD